MQQIIDVAHTVGPYAHKLADLGVKTVIRYYNHSNSRSLPTKCLTKPELAALHDAGLTVAVVFQAGGGKGGRIGDLSDANGTRDAERALALAKQLGQPRGSAIYFAVDHDYYQDPDLSQIARYFTKVKSVLAGAYTLGVYGSGTVARRLLEANLVDFIWLAGATGWSGTKKAYRDGIWTIFQKDMEYDLPFGGIDYDGNVLNPEHASFGQFSAAGPEETPRGVGFAATYSITARSGLNLRAGPAETFGVIQKYPVDTLVTGLRQIGDWIQVDIEGDGIADGYMHASYLRAISGGLPLPLSFLKDTMLKPLDVAKAEMAIGVAETPGKNDDNPRIVMYHATTSGPPAGDETAWCSSFVNYCVEQAGLKGTDSKWARSWHDGEWGNDVTAHPAQGDIVVFSRKDEKTNGGHVAFYMGETGGTILCLGGNQGDRIKMQSYPRNGVLGPFTYKLLSIRRA